VISLMDDLDEIISVPFGNSSLGNCMCINTVSTTMIKSVFYIALIDGGKWSPFVCYWFLRSLASVDVIRWDEPS
jgi:hypothetical protein